jgi:hypothetical protein
MRTARPCLLALVSALVLVACSGGDYQDVLRTLLEKQQLVEQARYHLLVAAVAAKNAVLATTAESASSFADEARAASGQVKGELARLGELITKVHEPKEAEALAQVATDFGELETVDAAILGMVGRNTNLRASKLSHTEATEAVARLQQALAPIADGADCPAAREALRAVAAVLTLLSLEDRHIDLEGVPDMDRLEVAMGEQNALGQTALDRLSQLLPAGSPALAQARSAWADFWGVHQTIVALSRENSNINSLALTMGRKRQILAQTLDDLSNLRTLVEAKSFKATR